MDENYKRKWQEALRNGGYLKTEGVLRDSTTGMPCFCAVGVLADIFVQESDNYYWDEDDYLVDKTTKLKYYDSLPREVLSMIGLEAYDECVITAINDKEDTDFDQVADALERY
jgi:hypothetical protein